MKTSEIITAVKRHKGPILVEVELLNNVHRFEVTKAEMLFRLKTILDGEAGYRIAGANEAGENRFIFGKEW